MPQMSSLFWLVLFTFFFFFFFFMVITVYWSLFNCRVGGFVSSAGKVFLKF